MFLNRFLGLTLIAVLMSTSASLYADEVPDNGVPDDGVDLFDDTYLMEPAHWRARGGYLSMRRNEEGYTHSGSISGAFIIDSGAVGIAVGGGLVLGNGGVQQGSLDVQVDQVRIPLDKKHFYWFAAGLEANTRISGMEGLRHYFKGQPVVLLGVMKKINVDNVTAKIILDTDHCELRLFGKLGAGYYYSNPNGAGKSSHSLTPSAGVRSKLRCATLKIVGEYEHIFGFGKDFKGKGGSVDSVNFDISKTWQFGFLPSYFKKHPNEGLGIYGKYNYSKYSDFDSTSTGRDSEQSFFGGVQLTF